MTSSPITWAQAQADARRLAREAEVVRGTKLERGLLVKSNSAFELAETILLFGTPEPTRSHDHR